MPNPQQIADQINSLIDTRLDEWTDDVVKSQNGMFTRVLTLLRELDLKPDGTIKQTVANLRLKARIQKELRNTIINDAYRKRVAGVVGEHDAIKRLNDGYFSDIDKIKEVFKPNKQLYQLTLEGAKQLTRDSLLEAGINQNIIKPVEDILTQNITTGGTFENLLDQLRTEIKGDEERLGNLERYSKQIVNDTLHQFNATYNTTIGTDLGLVFIYYAGSLKKTSRPFCKKAAGKYYHIKEFADFGRQAKQGTTITFPSGATAKDNGFVKATNEDNIFVYRGGYNCRHSIHYTDIDGVPDKVARRALKQGYITEKEYNEKL